MEPAYTVTSIIDYKLVEKESAIIRKIKKIFMIKFPHFNSSKEKKLKKKKN